MNHTFMPGFDSWNFLRVWDSFPIVSGEVSFIHKVLHVGLISASIHRWNIFGTLKHFVETYIGVDSWVNIPAVYPYIYSSFPWVEVLTCDNSLHPKHLPSLLSLHQLLSVHHLHLGCLNHILHVWKFNGCQVRQLSSVHFVEIIRSWTMLTGIWIGSRTFNRVIKCSLSIYLIEL